MNNASAIKTTGFLPRESARRPVSGEAMRANNEVHDVIMLLSQVVRGRDERSELMETRVDEITPVS